MNRYKLVTLMAGPACSWLCTLFCLQAGKTNLFNSWYTKSTTIEEFEVAQSQMTDQAGNSLRDNWVTALQVAFKSSFKDVGECSCTCVGGPMSSQPNTHFLKTRCIKLCSVSMIQLEKNALQ